MPAEVATSAELLDLDGRVKGLEDAPAVEVPPPYDDSALTGRVKAVEDTLATLPAPQTGTVTVGLPYTVINQPTDAAVQSGIKAWLANRSGAFPRTRLVFAFIGTADLRTPLLPADTGQIQGARWEGMSKRGTVLRWSSATTPLLTSYGQLRNWVFRDFTMQSGVTGAKGFYLRADNGRTNQDGLFDTLEHMGSWEYAYGFDGQDNTANLNSEIIFNRPALSNDASFTDAWLHSGMGALFQQENQFLNYTIRDSKLEGSHGDYLRFDKGGSVQVEGFNSWIHTGQANGGTPRGRMIYLPVGGNGDSVMFIHLQGMRPELRSNQSKLIDSSWSGAGCITFDTLRSAANAFKIPDFEAMTFRGDARVMLSNSHLAGHIGLRGSARPRMILDNVQAAGNQGVDWTQTTDGAGKGIVRTYESSSAANVKIR